MQISTEHGEQYERYCSETNMTAGCSNLLEKKSLLLKNDLARKAQGKSTVFFFDYFNTEGPFLM